MTVDLWQANAEPDMKQTGKRLQGIIAGLVEGVLELVADPYVIKQVCHFPFLWPVAAVLDWRVGPRHKTPQSLLSLCHSCPVSSPEQA